MNVGCRELSVPDVARGVRLPLWVLYPIGGVANRRHIDHHVVGGAGHFSFQSPFPPAMTRPGFPPSQDPPGFDRAAFQQILNEDTTAFLRASLGLVTLHA